jgi:O-antigen/teichoic acid export membrane protein
MRSKIVSLASDTMIYGAFTVAGRFLTFLLTPLYSNYMTVPEVGDVSNIFTIIAFINVLNSFGMEAAFFRFYSKDNYEQTRKAFTNSYLFIAFSCIALALLVIATSSIVAPVMLEIEDGALILTYAALIPMFDAFTIIPLGFLRMQRKALRFSLTRFGMIALAIMLNFYMLVVAHMGAKGAVLAQVLANLAGAVFFLPSVIKLLNLKIDWKMFREMLQFGIPTIPANISAIMLHVVDRPLLKLMTNSTEVGLYSVNHRLGIPMMMIASVFDYAWRPFYLSNYESKDAKPLFARILTYFTLVCASVFLVTSLFVDYAVRLPFVGGKLINPSFWGGMGIIPLILGGYFFNGVYTNFAAGFNIMKQTKYLPYPVGVAALLDIGLNLLLVPYFGYFGSAIAMFISYFVSAAMLYFFLRKVYPMKYEWKRMAIIIFSAVGVFLAAKAIPSTGWWTITVRFAAVAVFIGLLIWLKFFTKSEILSIKRLFKK